MHFLASAFPQQDACRQLVSLYRYSPTQASSRRSRYDFQVERRGKGASEKNPADAPIKCASTAFMFGSTLKAQYISWSRLLFVSGIS